MFKRKNQAVSGPGGAAALAGPNSGILSRVQQATGATPPASEGGEDDRIGALEERVNGMDEKLDSILKAMTDEDEAESKSATDDEETPAAELPDEESKGDDKPSSSASAARPASKPAAKPATIAELKAALPESTADFRELCVEAGYTLAQAKAAASMVAEAGTVAGAAAVLGTNQPFAVSGQAQGAGGETAEQQFSALVATRSAEIRQAEPSLKAEAVRSRATAEVYREHPKVAAAMNEERRVSVTSKTLGIRPEALMTSAR